MKTNFKNNIYVYNKYFFYLRYYESTILLLFSCCVQLFVIPWTAACQAPLS